MFFILSTHLVLQIQQFNSLKRPLLANVGPAVSRNPLGIFHPNEMPKHALKTIKVLILFRLPREEADNCHGMLLLQQDEQVRERASKCDRNICCTS